MTPAKIDKCSRYLFPLLFFGFNSERLRGSPSPFSVALIWLISVLYWTIMTVLSSIAEDLSKDEWVPIEIED